MYVCTTATTTTTATTATTAPTGTTATTAIAGSTATTPATRRRRVLREVSWHLGHFMGSYMNFNLDVQKSAVTSF